MPRGSLRGNPALPIILHSLCLVADRIPQKCGDPGGTGMTYAPLGSLMRHIRQMVGVSAAEDRTDADLLGQFASQRDEAAFAVLVQRHGPLVMGVCRRVLRDTHTAEDAFQATFLVLAKKAGAIRRREALAGWLHSVALNLALKAKAAAARRPSAVETEEPMTTEPSIDLDLQAARPLLDEELQRLPAKYRLPLVLCYLQGKSNRDVARELGWPEGSMARRLSRARDLLRERLTRRGVALSAAGCAAFLEGTAEAAVSPSLTEFTVQAALRFAAGEAGTGAAITLAKGALESMTLSRFRMAVLAVVVLGAGIGTSLLAMSSDHRLAAPEARGTEATAPMPAQRPQQPVRLAEGGGGRMLGFTADGRTLFAIGSTGVLRWWEAATGKEQGKLTPQKEEYFLAVSPDGQTVVATGRSDHACWLVIRWVATGKEKMRLDLDQKGDRDQGQAAAGEAAFSPNGKILGLKIGYPLRPIPAIAGYVPASGLQLWDLESGKQTWRVDENGGLRAGSYGRVSFTPDGRMFAALKENQVQLWEVATGKERGGIGVRTGAKQFDIRSPLAFSPDGKYLAVAGISVETKEPRSMIPHLVVMDARTGKEVRSIQWAPVRRYGNFTIAFGMGGKAVFASTEDRPEILGWETATGKELPALKDHIQTVTAMAFAGSGPVLASTCQDGTILIRDVTATKPDEREFPTLTADEVKQLEAIWAELALEDAPKAFQAIQKLAAMPKPTVVFLEKRVQPIPVVTAEQVAAIITDLGNDNAQVCNRAYTTLERLGPLARAALEEALINQPRKEVRGQVENLLTRLITAPPQLRKQRELQAQRSVEVLERIGNEDSRRVLTAIAQGHRSAPLTQEAAAALKRLKPMDQ